MKRIISKSKLDIRFVNMPGKSIQQRLNKNYRPNKCNKRHCPVNEPKKCTASNTVYKAGLAY